VPEFDLRDAKPDDFAALAAIAKAGDSEADDLYFTFLQTAGVLRVAADAGSILAFGGVLGIGDDTTMVTDLFVATHARGRGVGGALLAHLLDGAGKRMTFSSKHAAALPAYIRAGMVPAWRLLYLRGRSGARDEHADGVNHEVTTDPWRRARPDLADYFERRGGSITDNAAVITRDGETIVARLQDHGGADAFDAVLAEVPANEIVTCCAPEHSPVAARALARGFEVFDNDIFCCSPGVALPDDLHCLDPGLC